MKEFYIAHLKTDEEVQEFFMIKSIAVKTGSNKKQYLDLVLGDATGEVSAKKWDITDGELPMLSQLKDGDIVKIKGIVNEWNSLKQLKVLKIRAFQKGTDEIEFMDFIKSAPEKAEDMFQYLRTKAESIEDAGLKALSLRLLDDNKEKLMYYPAAAKNHHAEMAGLLYHMKRMMMTGEKICQVYTNLKRDLVLVGVIIHDIEKLNEIVSNEFGVASGYSFEGQMLGHLIQGVKVIDRLCEELEISKEKAIMLEHMVISHHYEPDFGSPKKPLFPEAEILHYLDIIDARMYDMADALQSTEEGEFSERVWTLDNRKLYKPQW